jgi:hypothetical protein
MFSLFGRILSFLQIKFVGSYGSKEVFVIFVSVDVGRSLVKVAYSDGTGEPEFFDIPSLVATSYSSFSNPNGSMVNSYLDQEMFQVEIKETQGGWNDDFASFFIFGKQAQKQGGVLVSFSEGSQFHKFGVAVTLYAVARAVAKLAPRIRSLGVAATSPVALSINLTYSNNDAVSFYSKALKGKHKVTLGVPRKGSISTDLVEFTVGELFCFQQGYASIFNFIGRKEFGVISKGRGLILDVGRYTVDFSLVEELTLVRGKSDNFGTRSLVEKLRGLIALQGVKLEMDEVESSFVDREKVFSNITGKKVFPWRLLQEGDLLKGYYGDIKIALNNFIGEERIDYIILCGGGSHLIYDFFIKDFRIPLLSLDYVRANVTGMLKMMTLKD